LGHRFLEPPFFLFLFLLLSLDLLYEEGGGAFAFGRLSDFGLWGEDA
jgi:hypothetical protein